jgi:hypothetical protein
MRPTRSLHEGVLATERQFEQSLERQAIAKIWPMGERFDSNLHQAMFEVPGTGQPQGTIVQVLQAGYTLHERLLRRPWSPWPGAMANPRAAMAPSAAMSTRLHDADAGQPIAPTGRKGEQDRGARRLPPRMRCAFEAVARSLSFTRAADQLLVTQSAVSRQVRLEDIMGSSSSSAKASSN